MSSLKAAPGSGGQHTNHYGEPPRTTPAQDNVYGSNENSSIPDCGKEEEIHEGEVGLRPQQAKSRETRNKEKPRHRDDYQERDGVEPNEKYHGRNMPNKDATVGQLPQDASRKLDREKIKAAFERRKAQGDITSRVDSMDELERELEDVEVPGGSETTKLERKQSWPKTSRPELDNSQSIKKGQSLDGDNFDTVEEGEVDRGYRSPTINGYSERDHKRQVTENLV